MRSIPILVALLLQAPASSPAAKGSLEGVVLGPGGQPVAGAQLQLMWYPLPAAYSPGSLPSATTDGDGRFRISDLAPADYRITAKATGYIQQEYGTAPGRSQSGTGTLVPVAAGKVVQGITITMSPGGVISGRITSVSGAPLLRMNVTVLKKTYDADGWSWLATEAYGETNDRGEYRIADVAPGHYVIRAAPMNRASFDSDVRRAQSERLPPPVEPTPGNFATVYFPGTADSSQAGLVDIQQRGETRSIDIVVPNEKTYFVRGRIVDQSNEPRPRLSLSIIPTPATVGSGSGSSLDQASGTFFMRNVPPGMHWFVGQAVLSMTEAERQERAQFLATPGADFSQIPVPPRGATLVKVADTDVSNVEVKIVRDLSLQGRIRMEGGTTSFAQLKPELRPTDTTGRTGSGPRATVDSEGNFVFRNFVPWEFRVAVSGLPPDLYMKEARFGRMDVLFQPFMLTEPPSVSLEVVLAKGGEVTGTLRNESSSPVAGKQVVLVPSSNRPALYKTGTTDAGGRFTIQGIAPGEYRALAWQTLEPYRYFDSAFVREFEDRGVRVVITGSSRETIDLKIIP